MRAQLLFAAAFLFSLIGQAAGVEQWQDEAICCFCFSDVIPFPLLSHRFFFPSRIALSFPRHPALFSPRHTALRCDVNWGALRPVNRTPWIGCIK